MPDISRQRARAGREALKKPKIIYTYSGDAAVFAGMVPRGAPDNDKPVLVFVPGLGKSAPYFWDGNLMYESAYSSGYRTAFVSFDKPDNQSQNMWSNGITLAQQLRDICTYYHVPRVVIVAHSKGGVDSQTAAVYYGAGNLVDSIVTLSTPHFGSQLADFAYSSSCWAFAELIKAHSPGCFSMQTGFMREYRNITDKNPNNVAQIKTFAGNGGADELSRMWAGSLLLDRYGENDGIVTVENAHNPNGKHLGTLHLNHAQMGSGHFIWPQLEPVLGGETQEPDIAASATPFCMPPAHIIKGGRLEKGVDESFHVDSTAENFNVTITFAGNTRQKRFMLISPDGKPESLESKNDLSGVTILRASVTKPQVGKWKLSAESGKGAYCALVSISGKDVFDMCPKDAAPGRFGAELRILRTYADGFDVVGEYSFKNGMELPVPPKLVNGVYNLELNLCGELDDGSTYERSVIRPLAAGNNLTEILRRSARL